jgi:hypothetical protein
MMGGETPETCSATHKRQVINLWNSFILFDLFEPSNYFIFNQFQSSKFLHSVRKVFPCFLLCFRTNRDYFPSLLWLTDIYNRDGICLLRGTQWFSKTKVRLILFFTGLILLKEINALFSQNHTKTINIASGQNAEVLSYKAGGTYRYHCTELYGLLLMQSCVRDIRLCVFYTADVGVGNL